MALGGNICFFKRHLVKDDINCASLGLKNTFLKTAQSRMSKTLNKLCLPRANMISNPWTLSFLTLKYVPHKSILHLFVQRKKSLTFNLVINYPLWAIIENVTWKLSISFYTHCNNNWVQLYLKKSWSTKYMSCFLFGDTLLFLIKSKIYIILVYPEFLFFIKAMNPSSARMKIPYGEMELLRLLWRPGQHTEWNCASACNIIIANTECKQLAR